MTVLSCSSFSPSVFYLLLELHRSSSRERQTSGPAPADGMPCAIRRPRHPRGRRAGAAPGPHHCRGTATTATGALARAGPGAKPAPPGGPRRPSGRAAAAVARAGAPAPAASDPGGERVVKEVDVLVLGGGPVGCEVALACAMVSHPRRRGGACQAQD